MTRELFDKIFDREIVPEIEVLRANNPLIKTKNLELCKEQIYREYQHLRGIYKTQIFSTTENLLDRHKVASCICGAFLKVSIYTKDDLFFEKIKRDKSRIESFFYYVNELIAVYAANRYLSFFMIKGSGNAAFKKNVIEHFPECPPLVRSEYGFWSNVAFNLSQVKYREQIEECYDIYSYAMFFFMLESHFNVKYCKYVSLSGVI